MFNNICINCFTCISITSWTLHHTWPGVGLMPEIVPVPLHAGDMEVLLQLPGRTDWLKVSQLQRLLSLFVAWRIYGPENYRLQTCYFIPVLWCNAKLAVCSKIALGIFPECFWHCWQTCSFRYSLLTVNHTRGLVSVEMSQVPENSKQTV